MVLAARRATGQHNAERQVNGVMCHVKHYGKRRPATSKIKQLGRQEIAFQTNGYRASCNNNVNSLSHKRAAFRAARHFS